MFPLCQLHQGKELKCPVYCDIFKNNMFELAQQLVGIYKVNNKTSSVSLANIEMH